MSTASKSRASRAASAPAGEEAVSLSRPSPLSSRRSASRTSFWSSAIEDARGALHRRALGEPVTGRGERRDRPRERVLLDEDVVGVVGRDGEDRDAGRGQRRRERGEDPGQREIERARRRRARASRGLPGRPPAPRPPGTRSRARRRVRVTAETLPRCAQAGTAAEGSRRLTARVSGRTESVERPHRSPRPEVERRRVHAVAQPRRLRPVVEDVAEVRVAAPAEHFRAGEEEAAVLVRLHARRRAGRREARPAGARVELRLRVEEGVAAGGAGVDARGVVVPVLAR